MTVPATTGAEAKNVKLGEDQDMQRHRSALRNHVFTGMVLASLMPASAFAQSAPADKTGGISGLEEVVVTA